MRNQKNDALMVMSGGLFGWLSLFCAMVGTCDTLPNGLNPADIGQPPQRAKMKGTDEQLYGPYKGKSLKELWRARDGFFKSGTVPTSSNELQRLLQWYWAIEKADPAFRSKTPIEFYGKAMDQYGNPVPSATVKLYWGKGTNLMMQTQQDGSFILSGATGAGLDVRLYKDGYDEGLQSYGSFDYINFFEVKFHLPNPTNPVIFRLQKLENPEPMYVSSTSLKLDVTNTVVWVDVCTGEKGATGDIGFSIVRDEFPGKQETGYTLNVLTQPGGGVVITNEEFMFHAPESGYSPQKTIPHRPSGPNDHSFQPSMEFKLYLKTADAKYAAIKVEVGQYQRPAAYVDLVMCFNPSGSRNLELGPVRLDTQKTKALRAASEKKKDTGKP
jgi:hypothetical protein